MNVSRLVQQRVKPVKNSRLQLSSLAERHRGRNERGASERTRVPRTISIPFKQQFYDIVSRRLPRNILRGRASSQLNKLLRLPVPPPCVCTFLQRRSTKRGRETVTGCESIFCKRVSFAKHRLRLLITGQRASGIERLCPLNDFIPEGNRFAFIISELCVKNIQGVHKSL